MAPQRIWVGEENVIGERNGDPLQYSGLGNPMGREDWRATVCRAPKKLDMTEQLNKGKKMYSCPSLYCSIWNPSPFTEHVFLSMYIFKCVCKFLSITQKASGPATVCPWRCTYQDNLAVWGGDDKLMPSVPRPISVVCLIYDIYFSLFDLLWICYNIASVFMFCFLVVRHVKF